MRLERILVPVDFSPRSHTAFCYAIQLARLAGARIDLLHVVPSPTRVRAALDAYLGRPIPHTPEKVVTDAEDRLEGFLGAVDHDGVEVRAHVSAGDPASMICELATEEPDDLMVMSLGRISKRLMTCAPCPVITLPA